MSNNTPTPAKAASGTPVGEYKVQVYLYDLSQGMAKALSLGFLGKQIDGIWHTGIVAFGSEYFYGGGIQASRPGGSMAGQPMQIIDMGYTRVTPATFHEFLNGVSHRFTAATYSLLDWNCNNFTNECCLFLTGKPIPAFITGLPADALATPFGQMLRPMITQMEQQMRGGGGGAGMIPWGSGTLHLPNTANVRPDRMVDPASNPNTPHNLVESAAALAAMAINQTTPSNATTATPTPASKPATATSPSSSSSSGGGDLVSLLGRTSKPRLLTSADKKAKSFQTLIKINAKKVPATPTGLSPEDDATLTELVNTLASDDASLKVKPAGAALVDSFFKNWSPALQFPVLGILRLLVLRTECLDYYTQHIDSLLKRLLELLPDDSGAATLTTSPANTQAMVLCTLANLLTHPSLQRYASSAEIWRAIRSTASTADNVTVRLMSATLAFNAAILLPKSDDDIVIESTTWLAEQVKLESEASVESRTLLALGEIILSNSSLAELLIGLDFAENLVTIKNKFPNDQQIQHTATEIGTILKKAQELAFQVE